MNKITFVFALTFLAVGCSKEEAAEAPAEVAAVVEEQATELAVDAEEATAADEVIQLVEESAADAEPENKPIVLAQADTNAVTTNWNFKEGQHFTRMIPTQPTVGGADQIEVAEVFMYSCPHCFTLEEHINRWSETMDPGVRLVRIPAMFNNLAMLHAQLYYTEVFMVQSGQLKDHYGFRNMVFEEIHRRGNQLTSETAIQRLFLRAGVSEDDFKRTWNSFEVNQAMRLGQDLARRYGVDSVPLIVVNGKYRTGVGPAGGYQQLLDLIDELTVREGLR